MSDDAMSRVLRGWEFFRNQSAPAFEAAALAFVVVCVGVVVVVADARPTAEPNNDISTTADAAE